MKYHRLFYLFLLVSFIFTSCSDDDNNLTEVSFIRPVFIMPSAYDQTEVTAYLPEPVTDELIVPIEVSGTATEGDEFTLSAKEFVFKPGEKLSVIKIIPQNNIYEDREIRIQFGNLPPGYKTGRNTFCIIPLITRSVYICSFQKEEFQLKNETAVTMYITNGTTLVQAPVFDIKVPFIIDPSSTAVLNEHYEIVGGECFVVMKAGTYTAQVVLRRLKKETGKDKIVLKISEDHPSFEAGATNRTIITISNP